MGAWFAKSRVLRLIMIRILGYDWLLLGPKQHEQVYADAEKKILDMALDLNGLGIARNFSFMVVLEPHVHEVRAHGYDHGLSQLGQNLAAARIIVCDALPCFEISAKAKDPGRFFWKKDFHPNHLGCEVIAECVYDCLNND